MFGEGRSGTANWFVKLREAFIAPRRSSAGRREVARILPQANPDLIDDQGGRRHRAPDRPASRGFEGAAISRRRPTVAASPGPAGRHATSEGGVDGTGRCSGITPYRASGPTPRWMWGPVYLEDDPVPFIRRATAPRTASPIDVLDEVPARPTPLTTGLHGRRIGRATVAVAADSSREGVSRCHQLTTDARPARSDPAVPDFDRHFRQRPPGSPRSCTVIGAGGRFTPTRPARTAAPSSAGGRRCSSSVQGVNIYDKMITSPTRPIMPISALPAHDDAAPCKGRWRGITGSRSAASPSRPGSACVWCSGPTLRPARRWPPGSEIRATSTRRALSPSADLPPAEIPAHPIPSWVQVTILVLSFRPILERPPSRQQQPGHPLRSIVGVRSMAWRRRATTCSPVWSSALAISYKVTPGLFLAVFRSTSASGRRSPRPSWGSGVFLVVVPSLVIGPAFNFECLGHLVPAQDA